MCVAHSLRECRQSSLCARHRKTAGNGRAHRLGINQSRMIRQLLAESLLLSAISVIVGLLFAVSALAIFELWLRVSLPRIAELNIDFSVVLFSLAAIALTSIAFGLAPAHAVARFAFYDRFLPFWREY